MLVKLLLVHWAGDWPWEEKHWLLEMEMVVSAKVRSVMRIGLLEVPAGSKVQSGAGHSTVVLLMTMAGPKQPCQVQL